MKWILALIAVVAIWQIGNYNYQRFLQSVPSVPESAISDEELEENIEAREADPNAYEPEQPDYCDTTICR